MSATHTPLAPVNCEANGIIKQTAPTSERRLTEKRLLPSRSSLEHFSVAKTAGRFGKGAFSF